MRSKWNEDTGRNLYFCHWKPSMQQTACHLHIWNIQVQPITTTCYQRVRVKSVWIYLCVQWVLVFMCCWLHLRHARNHRTDALLEDYGYNKLGEMQFVGNSSENCTRHAQLMITSNTLIASQQSLLNCQRGQLSNAQKMKWINSHSGQEAKKVIKPSFILHFSSLSILCAHFLIKRLNQSQKQCRQH